MCVCVREREVSYIALASLRYNEVPPRSNPSQLRDAHSMQVGPVGIAMGENRRRDEKRERERKRNIYMYCPSMSAQCSQE